MHNEFAAIIEQDEDWLIAYCPKISGANGHGRTSEECRQNLPEAIKLILEDRREDALRSCPRYVRHLNIYMTAPSEQQFQTYSAGEKI